MSVDHPQQLFSSSAFPSLKGFQGPYLLKQFLHHFYNAILVVGSSPSLSGTHGLDSSVWLPEVPFTLYVYVKHGSPMPIKRSTTDRSTLSRRVNQVVGGNLRRSSSATACQNRRVSPSIDSFLKDVLYLHVRSAARLAPLQCPWTCRFLQHYEGYFISLFAQLGGASVDSGEQGMKAPPRRAADPTMYPPQRFNLNDEDSSAVISRGWGYCAENVVFIAQLQPMSGGIQVFGPPLRGVTVSRSICTSNGSSALDSASPSVSASNGVSMPTENRACKNSAASAGKKTRKTQHTKQRRQQRQRAKKYRRERSELVRQSSIAFFVPNGVEPHRDKVNSSLALTKHSSAASSTAPLLQQKETHASTIVSAAMGSRELRRLNRAKRWVVKARISLAQQDVPRAPLIGASPVPLPCPEYPPHTAPAEMQNVRATLCTSRLLPTASMIAPVLPDQWIPRLWLRRHRNSLTAVLIAGGEHRRSIQKARKSLVVANGRSKPSPTATTIVNDRSSLGLGFLLSTDTLKSSHVSISQEVVAAVFPLQLGPQLRAKSTSVMHLQHLLCALLTSCSALNLRGAALKHVQFLEDRFHREQLKRRSVDAPRAPSQKSRGNRKRCRDERSDNAEHTAEISHPTSREACYTTSLDIAVSSRCVAEYIVHLLSQLRFSSSQTTASAMDASFWGTTPAIANQHLHSCLLPVIEAWLSSPVKSASTAIGSAAEPGPAQQRWHLHGRSTCSPEGKRSQKDHSALKENVTKKKRAHRHARTKTFAWWLHFPLGSVLHGVRVGKIPWLKGFYTYSKSSSTSLCDPKRSRKRRSTLQQSIFAQLLYFMFQHLFPFWVRSSFHVFHRIQEGGGAGGLGFIPVSIWRRMIRAELNRNIFGTSGSSGVWKQASSLPSLHEGNESGEGKEGGVCAAVRFMPCFEPNRGTRVRRIAVMQRWSPSGGDGHSPSLRPPNWASFHLCRLLHRSAADWELNGEEKYLEVFHSPSLCEVVDAKEKWSDRVGNFTSLTSRTCTSHPPYWRRSVSSGPNQVELSAARLCLENASLREAVRTGLVTPLSCVSSLRLRTPAAAEDQRASSPRPRRRVEPLRQCFLSPLHPSTAEQEYLQWRGFVEECRRGWQREAIEQTTAEAEETGEEDSDAGALFPVVFLRCDGSRCFDRLRQEAVWAWVDRVLPSSTTLTGSVERVHDEAFFLLSFTVWASTTSSETPSCFPRCQRLVSQTEVEEAQLLCIPSTWIWVEEPIAVAAAHGWRSQVSTCVSPSAGAQTITGFPLPLCTREQVRRLLRHHIYNHYLYIDPRHQPGPPYGSFFHKKALNVKDSVGNETTALNNDTDKCLSKRSFSHKRKRKRPIELHSLLQQREGIIQGAAVSSLLCHGALANTLDVRLRSELLPLFEAEGPSLYCRHMDDILLVFASVGSTAQRESSHANGAAVAAMEAAAFFNPQRRAKEPLPSTPSSHWSTAVGFFSNSSKHVMASLRPQVQVKENEWRSSDKPYKPNPLSIFEKRGESAVALKHSGAQQETSSQTYGVPWCGLSLQCRVASSHPRSIRYSLEACIDWNRSMSGVYRVSPSFLWYRYRYPSARSRPASKSFLLSYSQRVLHGLQLRCCASVLVWCGRCHSVKRVVQSLLEVVVVWTEHVLFVVRQCISTIQPNRSRGKAEAQAITYFFLGVLVPSAIRFWERGVMLMENRLKRFNSFCPLNLHQDRVGCTISTSSPSIVAWCAWLVISHIAQKRCWRSQKAAKGTPVCGPAMTQQKRGRQSANTRLVWLRLASETRIRFEALQQELRSEWDSTSSEAFNDEWECAHEYCSATLSSQERKDAAFRVLSRLPNSTLLLMVEDAWETTKPTRR